MGGKVWRERFSMDLAPEIDALNRSAHFDWRLGVHDLDVSRVWARALRKGGALTADDVAAILKGLDLIDRELSVKGSAFPESGDEDIHMAVERRLGEIIGEPAEKLHFGRSRNDMVATDILLYLKGQSATIMEKGRNLIKVIVDQAQAHKATPFPGYTHLQQAQVVSLGHIFLAHAIALQRDISALSANLNGMDKCPLGSGALAGTYAPVDTGWIAAELGFSGPAANSIDAVGSRDAIIDFLYIGARLGIHLSRLGEDMILWSSQEFGYITLGDNSTTGSSLLPHKKNPDVFELARGKAGRLIGNLHAILAVLKGLPAGYNKDLQEDKEALFDTVETLNLLLPAVATAVDSLTVHSEAIRAAMIPEIKMEGVVQLLTERGSTFRAAYRMGQALVRKAVARGLHVTEFALGDLQNVSPELDQEVLNRLQADYEIPKTGVAGGASIASVETQIEDFRTWLGAVT
ncbi:MAG: argininosuccinate lyase [Candidatus Marinimicrobia bacterium]|nr:argininosuccinate lyase [Candidatus Neomarinimicrobiota bacterium]